MASGASLFCLEEKVLEITMDLRSGSYPEVQRIYRLYREEGLNLRSRRPKRNRASAHRLERPQLSSINQCWSMDFVADHRIVKDPYFDGRKFRALTIVDN
jgi:putative transposase